MNILRFSFMLVTLTFTSFPVFSAPLKNYLYTSSGNLEKIKPLLIRPDIDGVQIVYNWNILEKQKNQYDFSEIEKDLEYVNKLHKNLFIQLQDRFFSPDAKNVPYYLLNEPVYKKGLVHQYDNPGENKPIASGWVAQQWNPEVQKRYQKLISELAKKFDGRIFGINLPETAIDIDIKKDTTGFTCEKYFNAEIENALFTRKAFKKSHVVQYINFWPCEWNNDHQYMSKFFALAEKNNIGLGGPDIIPNKKGHMKNAYPFFHQYKGKLGLVAMAVQEPTLTYTNPQTRRPFTKAEFTDYAENYLGADIIFWSLPSPWLDRQ